MRLICFLLLLCVAGASAKLPCWSKESCLNWARNELLELVKSDDGTVFSEELVLGLLDDFKGNLKGVLPGATPSPEQQWCPNTTAFAFVPLNVANVAPGNTSTWVGNCLVSASVSVTQSATGATVEISGADPNSTLCSDLYSLGTSYRSIGAALLSASSKASSFNVEWLPHELQDVQQNGVRVLMYPCGLVGTILSVIKTASLFIGTGASLRQTNADFLLEKGVWESFEVVNETQPLAADPSLIRSGDYMAVARLDGLDPMIMFGTGGHTGHSVVFVWDGPQLYAVESTAADPFGHVYWPPPYGIIRTPWEKWYPLAVAADYHVAVLPLAARYSAGFNESRFWAWFQQVQGQPYGFHTMLYSFLDTSRPMANLPAPIDDSVFQLLLSKWGAADPSTNVTNGGGVDVYALFIEALNHRMGGVSCSNMSCVTDFLVAKGMTLGELTAIPEVDGWKYDKVNVSMVCSEFAAHVWKTGLGDLLPPFEAAEQTPKDNYQMEIYDASHFTSQNCPNGLVETPQGSYCQIMGYYRLNLPGYNRIVPYAGMNNHCPAQWPDYFRCPPGNNQCC